MNETLVIFGLSLSKVWVAFGIGCLLTVLFLRKKEPELLAVLLNGFIITILFYRFGPFFFDPGSYLKEPLLFIHNTGGVREILTGLVVTAFYFLYRHQRQPFHIESLIDALAIGLLMILFVKSIMISQYGVATELPWGVRAGTSHYHPLNLYHAIWLFGVMLILWLRKFRVGEGKFGMWIGFSTGFVWLICSFIAPVPVYTWGNLSPAQWLDVFYMMASLMLYYRVYVTKIHKGSEQDVSRTPI